MEKINSVMEIKKEIILSKYPQKTEATTEVFRLILDMLQEDVTLIEQKNKRLKKVYSYIISILETGREQNVKKQHILDSLDVFLDENMLIYLTRGIEKYREDYVQTIRCARGILNCSQWSDSSSTHWQRAIDCLKIIK